MKVIGVIQALLALMSLYYLCLSEKQKKRGHFCHTDMFRSTTQTGKIKASWRTGPRQWPAVVWSSLQCSWTKSTKDSIQNSSTAMRKTHCHLSLNYSCVCQRWHNQLVGWGANWSILVLNDSLSSTNHFFLKRQNTFMFRGIDGFLCFIIRDQ